MKKRYKLGIKGENVYILRWLEQGLFGASWSAIATFSNRDNNAQRCKKIVQLMNECNKHTDTNEDDRT